MDYSTRRYVILIWLAFLSFCLALISGGVEAQQSNYVRDYYTVSDGLSQNEVTTICEDKYGFIWFGTRGGLNRFDGYEFKQFKPNRETKTSLQNPSIERLFIDKKGDLWIGTKSGAFSIYDQEMESMSFGKNLMDDPPDRVISFLEDIEGRYWIGSFYNGLKSYNPLDSTSQSYLAELTVSTIIQSEDSTIWVGSNQGLFYKKPGSDFVQLPLFDRYFEVTSIVEDSKNPYLWLSGWGLQLVRFNYQDFSYKIYHLPETKKKKTNSYSLLEDRQGNLWVGTWGGGLFRFNKETEVFNKVEINPDFRIAQMADYDIILDIFQDSKGIIWIGSDGGGVVKLLPASNFKRINSFSNTYNLHVTSVYTDTSDQLFVGTRGHGLFWSGDRKKFVQLGKSGIQSNNFDFEQSIYFIDQLDENTYWFGTDYGIFVLKKKQAGYFDIIEAADYFNSPDLKIPKKVLNVLLREDELWVGSQQMSLFLFKKINGQFSLEKNFLSSNATGALKNNRISNLFLDGEQNLWVGTYNGLFRYSPADSTFISLRDKLEDSPAPLCPIILCSYVDAQSNIWFGTPCSLNKISQTEKGNYKLKEYTQADGLPDDYVSNIVQDANNNIWLTTNAGISKLYPANEKITHYGKSDGIGDYYFSEASHHINREGFIYFGGFAGLTYFNPKEISEMQSNPKIAVSNFSVLNSEVPVTKDGILKKSINEIEKLTLTYKDKEVSIEFVALDYKSPQLNQYSYQLLKGDDLVLKGNSRTISLRNLKPATYRLIMKGSNSNGIWGETGRSLEIEVKTPPWKSPIAIFFYLLFIGLLIWTIIHISLRQERLVNNIKLEKIKREQQNQLNEYKLEFFTNVSHEFRTPLTLILAPINELNNKDLSNLDSDIAKKIELISFNSRRLLRLVNQLLEFRKVRKGKARLEASNDDIISYIKEVIHSFDELAKSKKIRFSSQFKSEKCLLFFDEAKMWVILNNLLLNAFKYCKNEGEVKVSVNEDEEAVIIEVSNDGPGLSQPEIGQIFNRFYQKSNNKNSSSGIGLFLVKSYVDLHKGSIEVFSERNVKTSFIVKLKKGDEHLSSREKVEKFKKKQLPKVIDFDHAVPEQPISFHPSGTKGAKILLVEDNPEIATYLEKLLSQHYEVSLASNGKIGFEKAIELLPDLILSDVMMPVMDGFEMCQKVKSHSLIWHIPVILLTGKDSPKAKMLGAKKGADIYIVKPFDPNYLIEKIKHILMSRKALASKYGKKITLEPQNKEITRESEKFLADALSSVEKNIGNSDLNVKLLANNLNMSISTLNRKMKNIAGQRPGEFIRVIRMKRAAQLLKDTDLSVSEIADRVGYQDVSRFRESFKSEYSETPGNFRRISK